MRRRNVGEHNDYIAFKEHRSPKTKAFGAGTDMNIVEAKIKFVLYLCVGYLFAASFHWMSQFLPLNFIHKLNFSRSNVGTFRLTLALVIFFGLHATLSSPLFFFIDSSVRIWFQKQISLLRFLLFIGIYTAVHWIPLQLLSWFASLCVIVAFFYMVIQVLCVIDFSYRWKERWTRDYEAKWLAATIIFSVIFIVLSLIATFYEYRWFGGWSCHFNLSVISFTIFTSIALIILSILIERGFILTSSVIMLYSTLLSFQVLISNPDDQCHTTLGTSSWYVQSAFNVIFVFLSLLHTSLFVSNIGQTALSISGRSTEPIREYTTDDENNAFFYFHLFMMMTSAYMAMMVTGWSTMETDGSLADLALGYDFMRSWRTIYIKLFFLAATLGLYFWSLIAPLVCEDRDFS